MRLKTLIFSLMCWFVSSLAYADIGNIMQIKGKAITVYAEPAVKAKVVTNLAIGQQIILVFAQGDWMKVANPANGDIGWVKQIDLQQTMPVLSQQADWQILQPATAKAADTPVSTQK